MHQEGPDRRKWPRIPASSLGHLSAAVVAGPDVKLVNLSRGGALIEVAARFPMRSSVRLKLMQANGEVLVAPGRVAWAKVASIVDRQVNYTVAVIFDQLLPEGLLPADAGPQEESEETVLLDSIFSAEQDATSPAGPARDNLTQFPSVAVRRTDSAPPPPAAATTTEPPAPSVIREALTAQLAESDHQRTALRAELDAAQRRWDEERARFEETLAAAVMRADTVQAALTTQEQAQAQTLADQRARYEALTAELLASANDQQAEYQQLVDERTAERDALRGQVEEHAAELLRHHSEWEQQRAALEMRVHELEARVEAADALCAAHNARARALQLEAEKLMALIAAPLAPDASQHDETASAEGTSKAQGQAVA